MMDIGVKQDIETAARILREHGAKEVFVFGSAAEVFASGSATKRKMRPDSDIDLAVRGLPPEQYFHACGKALMAITRMLDVIDLDGPNPFAEYLEQEGELVRVD